MARLCDLFAERLEETGIVGEKLRAWPDDGSARRMAIPLRVAGALHGLVLEGRSPELKAIFPPLQVDDDALWRGVCRALNDHSAHVLSYVESAPQTNEVRRSGTLLAAFLTIAAMNGSALRLSEIGASAGLNLYWDRYRYRLGTMEWGDPESPVEIAPEWTGEVPPAAGIDIRDRAGCDRLALDPGSHADRVRLLSYIWPDQIERMERAQRALAIVQNEPVRVERKDVLESLPGRLKEQEGGVTHVVYQTIVWQYLSAAAQARLASLIQEAGERASGSAPLAWLRLEPDGKGEGAALTLTLWPLQEERQLARVDYHGRWIKWAGW